MRMGAGEKQAGPQELPMPRGLDEIWFKLRDAAPFGAAGLTPVRPEWQSDFRLVAVTGGQGMLAAGDRAVPLRSGVVYISPPGENLRADVAAAYRLEMYVFRFQALTPDETDSGAVPLPRHAPEIPLAGEPLPYPATALVSLCKTVCACRSSLDPLERFRGQTVFEDLLHRLFKEALSGSEQQLDAALETVRTYIEQHYEKEVTVKRLAEMSRISPRHLMRLFKESYGMTIGEYTKELRRAGKRPAGMLARSALAERYLLPEAAGHRFG
ncbi:AraC family transcriptional regulator [Paenibacillus sp. B01]|nr:AraC family transcriptional regulator [Paenibacillus sp. B01]